MEKIKDDDPDWIINLEEAKQMHKKALEIFNQITGDKIMEKETVNHPQHYNRENSMECIDEMILVFGIEAVKHFCLCNAWKYRYRAADKNGQEDIAKSDWYINKYKELCNEGKATITVSRPDIITVPYINNDIKTTPAIVPSSVCNDKQFYVDYNKPTTYTTSTSYTTTGTVNS